MITYSQRSRLAYARLFSFYNDIDIFVEDASYVGVYERILKKNLPENVRISKVIPLGPKNIVEQKALQLKDDHSRKRLFIVDGDLDLISRQKINKTKSIYSLRVYSIENLLCENLSIEKYFITACPGKTFEQIKNLLDVDSIIQDIGNLTPYMMILGIARYLKLHGSVYSINARSVTKQHEKNKYITTCRKKIFLRVKDIMKDIVNRKGWSAYFKAKKIVTSHYTKRKITPLKIVPGKDFLMPIINDRVAKCGGVGNNIRLISSYMADNCTLMNDPGLRKILLSHKI